MANVQQVMEPQAPRPWWREPWPWLLMAGPATVVVAGIVTAWIAVSNADGLVAEDYYKQGLAINKLIAREELAVQRGILADLDASGSRLRVRLTGAALPVAVFVSLAHATHAEHDQRLRLARVSEGTYEAQLTPLPAGHWRVSIQDPKSEWRVAGNWSGIRGAFTLDGRPARDGGREEGGR